MSRVFLLTPALCKSRCMDRVDACHQRTCNFRSTLRSVFSLLVRRARTTCPMSKRDQSISTADPVAVSVCLVGADLGCRLSVSSCCSSSIFLRRRVLVVGVRQRLLEWQYDLMSHPGCPCYCQAMTVVHVFHDSHPTGLLLVLLRCP